MRPIVSKITSSIAFLLLSSVAVLAADGADSGGGSWFPYIIIAALLFGAAFFLWKKSSKPAADTNQYDYNNRLQGMTVTYNEEGLDLDKELEIFRKAKRSAAKASGKKGGASRKQAPAAADAETGAERADFDLSTRVFQEKMRRMQFAQLPVNSFIQLTDARDFANLPISSDEGLLSAIEQAQDEYEEDDAVRELAVKILARFRNRNSVEALSQIALYDLSSNLRSKAVNILTEFDHESVFETILLACADPTREVRAAAARGLFRLSFDRAEAWKRIIGTKDKFRMSHAARAAIESGIAAKAIDRLLHDDMKIAYEGFVLTALLIKAGEAEILYNMLVDSPEERVKLALLHVFSVVNDEESIEMLRKITLPHATEAVHEKLREIAESVAVPA